MIKQLGYQQAFGSPLEGVPNVLISNGVASRHGLPEVDYAALGELAYTDLSIPESKQLTFKLYNAPRRGITNSLPGLTDPQHFRLPGSNTIHINVGLANEHTDEDGIKYSSNPVPEVLGEGTVRIIIGALALNRRHATSKLLRGSTLALPSAATVGAVAAFQSAPVIAGISVAAGVTASLHLESYNKSRKELLKVEAVKLLHDKHKKDIQFLS